MSTIENEAYALYRFFWYYSSMRMMSAFLHSPLVPLLLINVLELQKISTVIFQVLRLFIFLY